jgi:hypothetical protein
MRGSNGSGVRSRFRQACDRFAQWRHSRKSRTRIPERLWQLAVELAVTYGVSRTASALKLDYYALKRRLEDNASSAMLVSPPHDQAGFLELPTSTLGASGECVIDFENSSGAKMRVHLRGMAAPDLVALSRSLWSAE